MFTCSYSLQSLTSGNLQCQHQHQHQTYFSPLFVLKTKSNRVLALPIFDTSFIEQIVTLCWASFLWLWFYEVLSLFISFYIRRDICDKSQNFPMCPRCDRGCPYWHLYDTCIYSKVGYSKFYSVQFNQTTFHCYK